MLEIELELPVNIRVIDVAQHPSLFRHLLVKRSSGYGRVQHELMKIGVV